MRNIVVIAQGKPIATQVLLAIHSCTDAGCHLVCNKGTRLLRRSRLCSGYMEADFYGADDDRFVAHINRLAADLPDLLLIPADCAGTRMVNRVRGRLHAAVVPAPDTGTLDRLENKWRFYRFCEEHGLRAPRTRYIGAKDDLDFAAAAWELGLPFVVKPVAEQGSNGVRVIASEDDYDKKIRANAAYRYAPLIAQRYIRGADVGLNLLAIHGKVAALAIQQPIDQHLVGSRIRFIGNAYLEQAAHRLAEASHYHGVMNVDARIEDGSGRVYLLESNPRFWRTLVASAWCGLNFVAASMDAGAPVHGMRRLVAGSADTYHHPLFRPAQWRYLAGRGQRARLVRRMMFDFTTLASSAKALLLSALRHDSQRTVAAGMQARAPGLIRASRRKI
jgi:predicted ATP-grasp superfamily ATP-dependent carboligase